MKTIVLSKNRAGKTQPGETETSEFARIANRNASQTVTLPQLADLKRSKTKANSAAKASKPFIEPLAERIVRPSFLWD